MFTADSQQGGMFTCPECGNQLITQQEVYIWLCSVCYVKAKQHSQSNIRYTTSGIAVCNCPDCQ